MCQAPALRPPETDENSIVAMLRYNNFRELFMGDAGESSEARLLASGTDLRRRLVYPFSNVRSTLMCSTR